jgi:transposase-like protein
MDDKILFLYAQGMTTREIVTTFKEMYGADVSPALISKVTDAVIEQVIEWQSRPLDPVYPIVYLDCIVVKIRQDKRVINKAIHLALGVNMDGHKELLGLWLTENEGAKFWLNVLTELQNRGVKDILIACVDGLKGFPDAISAAFPGTQIQLCIVHMVRNSLKYVSWKDYKAVTADLKRIYQSVTEEEALLALDQFAERWDEKYPTISRSWRGHWQHLNTLFQYPEDIRRAIYTTNAIESLNSVVRKAVKKRKLFPTDDSAMKVVYLAIMDASKRWTMPIWNWKAALNRFMIDFEDRLINYV